MFGVWSRYAKSSFNRGVEPQNNTHDLNMSYPQSPNSLWCQWWWHDDDDGDDDDDDGDGADDGDDDVDDDDDDDDDDRNDGVDMIYKIQTY